jgi:EAL domain-containing protein (putative c-di-GMP-specific phosphodiesterase class I)/CheY-like chemotaxis protein
MKFLISDDDRGDLHGKLALVDRIKVLIAEDDPTVRAALADLVGEEEDMDLVGTAGDADEAIEVAERGLPDVVLCDVRMPRGGGRRAVGEIISRVPEAQVLALSAHEDRSTVLGMLQAGAIGFLVKGASADDIVEAVRRAARGESSLSNSVAGDVIREVVGQMELREHAANMRRRRTGLVRGFLDGGDMRMVFQPIVDLGSLAMIGVEALARFGGKPSRPPNQWFEEASLVGMRADLELAAVRAAFGSRPPLPEGVWLAVNVSPATALSDEFPVLGSEVGMETVVFEISEHARVADYEGLIAVLDEIRARGARLAIDDAGAGFASLQHILRLSPDYIKLDMGLTRGVDADPARRALASALTSFGNEIGASLIAEGIETAEELATLRGLGVRYGQGFYLGRPSAEPSVTLL